jgi:predicted DNA-binding transcriptional regulator
MEAFALQEKLRSAGLTGNEAKVYAVLLHHCGLSGGDVARKVSIDRSLAYTLLHNLADKGLVTFEVRNTKRHFFAADPENLLTPVRQREHLISALVPQLRSITPVRAQDQSFRVFEGIEGMKAYANLLLTQKSYLSFGGTGRFYDLIMQHAPHLVRAALDKKRRGRVIGSTQFLAHPLNKLLGIRVRYLPTLSPATTTVCDDFVAIHLITDKPFALIIKNREVVEGYRNYFEFLWKQASAATTTGLRSTLRRPRARTRPYRTRRRS